MYKTLHFRLRRHIRWLKPKITGKLIGYLLLVSILPLLLFMASSLDVTRKMVLHIAQDYSGQLLTNQRDYLQLLTEQVESLASNIAGVEDIGNVMSTVDIDAGFDRSAYHELATQAKVSYILNGYSNIRGLVSIDIFSYLGYHFHVGEPLPTVQVNEAGRKKLYQAALDAERPLMWAGMQENLNVSSSQKLVVSAVKVIYHYYPKTQQSNPVGMLVINYSPAYLYQHFSQLDFGRGSYFMVVDATGRLIFHPDKSQLGKPISGPLQELLKGKEQHRLIEYGGATMLFNHAKLANTGWRVLLMVPEQTLLLPMRGLMRNAAILLFLCFAAIALVAYRYTRSVVVPIKAISSGFRQIQRGPSGKLAPLAVSRNKDEIAELVLWFNTFLEGIQAREDNQRQLMQAKLAADLANQSKSEFLANMSHEIRTPMNAILGMTQLAMSATSDGARSNYLNKANRAAYSLLGIINDILDISKIEAGKITLEMLPVQLPLLLAEVVEVICSGAQEKGLELLIDIDPALPAQVQADPLRLRQVLLNLMGNALKFTDHGQIILRLQKQAQDAQQVTLRFSVKDSGIGISSEQQSQLFQQFTQADTSTTRRYGGTGLGLSICKHLVELMGGSIEVESETGIGSEFFFNLSLPILPAPAKLANPDQAIPLPIDLQLLIIDDNPHARAVFSRMAAQLQLHAHSVARSEDALQWLQAQTQANVVVLLDYPLGNERQNSVRCYEQLRALPQRATLPVIFMNNQDVDEVFLQKQLQSLSKPFLSSDLANALRQACGLQKFKAHKQKLQSLNEFKAKLSGKHILLVEDNLLNQELALALLHNVGIVVDLAQDGQQALEKISIQRYDAVLMDCQMPVMDGYQATRILRSQSQYADLPILALTAHALVGEREKSLAAGMNDHLTKPVKPTALYQALINWLKPMPETIFSETSNPTGKLKAEVGDLDGSDSMPADRAHSANTPSTASAALANEIGGTPPSTEDAALEAQVDAMMAQIAQQSSKIEEASGPAHFAPEQALENLLGNRAMFQRMAKLFLQEAQDFAPQFRAAWQNERASAMPLEEARRIAHTMKSSSAIVGGMRLQDHARQLEQACLKAQDEEITKQLALLESELALVKQSLQQYLQQLE